VKNREGQLTLDLLLLRLEDCARGLGRLLQLENSGVLLLASLSQLVIRHALLDEFPDEPRDLCIPKLERSPRLLQRGVHLLELALRFLPSRALTLKGGLSLIEGGPLMLELTLHLLMHAPLLAKLLLHRGE
jgi:hypothetical protein